MKSICKIQTEDRDCSHYAGGDYDGAEQHREHYTQQNRSMNDKEISAYNQPEKISHYPEGQYNFHPRTFETSYIHDIPPSPTNSYHSEREQEEMVYSKSFTPRQQIEERRASYTPSQSAVTPPPKASRVSIITPQSHHKRPFMPLLSPSDTPPRMTQITNSTHTTNNPTYPHLHPSWYQQQHQEQHHHNTTHDHYNNYDRHNQYDQYGHYGHHDQEQYPETPYPPPPPPSSHDAMTSPSSRYRQGSSANPHYRYTFDQNQALNTKHQASYHQSPHSEQQYYSPCHNHHHHHHRHHHRPSSEDCWPQAPLSSSCSDGKAYYQKDPANDAYYEDCNDENDAHPLLRNYNPDLDGYHTNSPRGNNHKLTFDKEIQDTSRYPHMPEAASEVDFDIIKPPMTPITQPSKDPFQVSQFGLGAYDVLFGRGGGANRQTGNCHFRSLVQEFQPVYLTLKRKEKPLMARSLVLIVRQRGGRFLRKGENKDEYYEVGDEKAEAKASQALREGMEVRATTRKRKEIGLQQRDDEIERKKMMMCRSSKEGRGDEEAGQGEQSRMSLGQEDISNMSSTEKEDRGTNEACSSSSHNDEQTCHYADSLAFQSPPEDKSLSSRAASFYGAIEEFPLQPQALRRIVSRDEEDQQGAPTLGKLSNEDVHIVPCQ